MQTRHILGIMFCCPWAPDLNIITLGVSFKTWILERIKRSVHENSYFLFETINNTLKHKSTNSDSIKSLKWLRSQELLHKSWRGNITFNSPDTQMFTFLRWIQVKWKNFNVFLVWGHWGCDPHFSVVAYILPVIMHTIMSVLM